MAKRTAAPGSGRKANKTEKETAPTRPKSEVAQPGTEGAQPEPETEAEVVQSVLDSIKKKVVSAEIKATLGDFIRLLQLRRELEEDELREVEVTWIDPDEKN